MEEKKPHPFSKEGRALREQKVETKVETNIEPKKVQIVDTKVETQSDLSKILERLERLEAENKKLKDGQNVHKDEKKIYDGPLSFKFKLWGGKPVCNLKSKYKDPTKDLLYKDGKGVFISNHLVEITLSDGTIAESDVNDFGRDVKYSEQYFPKDHNGEDIFKDTLKRVKHYTFNTDEFGTFTVLPNSIN